MVKSLKQGTGNIVRNVNYLYNSSLSVLNVPFKAHITFQGYMKVAYVKALLHATNRLKLRNTNSSSGKGSLNGWAREPGAFERIPEGKPTNICFQTT